MNVNAMDALLVIEPLVTVADVMVMVGGGRTNVTLEFPKNAMSGPGAVGEVYVVPLIVLLLLIVTIRFEEVLLKALVPIDVTESGMFMDVNILQVRKASISIELTALPIVTDVKLVQKKKALLPIDVTELPMVNDVKPLQL